MIFRVYQSGLNSRSNVAAIYSKRKITMHSTFDDYNLGGVWDPHTFFAKTEIYFMPFDFIFLTPVKLISTVLSCVRRDVRISLSDSSSVVAF